MSETPTCWEEGASAAADEILSRATVHQDIVPDATFADWVTADLDGLRKRFDGDLQKTTEREYFLSIGNAVIANHSTKPHVRHQFVTGIVDLACSKQHDYGHDNINAFGLHGIIVRISDKVARLKNLLAKDTNAKNESLDDTKADLLGYAIVGMMFIDGTFQLPLRAAVLAAEIAGLPIDTGIEDAVAESDQRDVWARSEIERIVYDVLDEWLIDIADFGPAAEQQIRAWAQEEIADYVGQALDVHEEIHHPTPSPWPLTDRDRFERPDPWWVAFLGGTK